MPELPDEYKPKTAETWRVITSSDAPDFLQKKSEFKILEEPPGHFRLQINDNNEEISVPLNFIDRQFMQSDEFKIGSTRFRLNLKLVRDADRFRSGPALYGSIDGFDDNPDDGDRDETEMGVFGAEEDDGTESPSY